MILPVEVGDALDALRAARERVGYAVDALAQMGAPTSALDPFTQAHEATSWSVEHVAAAITAHRYRAATDAAMEAVEERHIDCQTFPWANEP